MRKFLIVFGVSIFIMIVLILIGGVFLVNREDENYKSSYQYIDAKTLSEKIRNEDKNAIVIITSASCSGSPEFMPKIEKQQEYLNQENIKVYYVIDMLNRDTRDSLLTGVIKKYNINYIPLIINPIKHPSGNLFNASRKYDTFLTQLCNTCNDGSLGYPFYIYFRKGEYVGKSYYLNNSILATLN